MALINSKNANVHAKEGQREIGVELKNDSEINTPCTGCGESNPEYVIDHRKLCFDCYKAEKYYWVKACTP